ncbi:unnamed protein product [Acanthosepion pharaonis]|uniref:Uncharacterized protein n=1 Tax=Acanthosepion pharaonis TaxID=158019 RepID=A0A812EM06_ACAPH|nr:unnamed protein product [Sepia pharaonis]
MMNLPKSRKEFVCIDHSDVYYKNERLEDNMRCQVVSLCKDEHRCFLNRQSEITRTMENLEKLQALRPSLKNTAPFCLAANLHYKCPVPMQNYVIEKLTNKESNKIYRCPESGPLDLRRENNSAAIHRKSDKKSSLPVTYETGNHYYRTASSIYSPTNCFDRISSFDISRPYSVIERPNRSRILASSNLKPAKSAPFFKTSSQSSSSIKYDTSLLNKRPSSCKEQWAGLRDDFTQKRNSSTAAKWSRFRAAKTRRNCTVVCQTKFLEALTLRRLREIHILEEPEVGVSGNRRTNFVQNLLLLNQKKNEMVQEKVKKFLLELGEKQRKISMWTKVSRSMLSKGSPINDTRTFR